MRKAIEKRISRRKYKQEPIPEDLRKKIITLIDDINKGSGLGIEFIEDGSKAFNGLKKSYGLFTDVRSIILMKGKMDLENLKEKIGYYGEDLVLSLTDLGLGTCWVGGSFDKDEIKIPENEELVCVVVVGVVAEFSIKEKIIRTTMHLKTKPKENRIISDSELPSWVEKGMEAVLVAPSAINSQKATFRYEVGILNAEIADDYRFDLVDLGIAKKHFEIEAGGKFDFGNGGIFHLDDERGNDND